MQLYRYKINIIDNFLETKLYNQDLDLEIIKNIYLNVNVSQKNILIIRKYIMKWWNQIISKKKKKNIINIKQRELVVIFIFNSIKEKFGTNPLFTNLVKMIPTLITTITFCKIKDA